MTPEAVLSSLVAPVLVVVVSLMGAWGKEAAQRRSQEQVRQRRLTFVKDEIGVIDAWARAHAALDPAQCPPTAVCERARLDLDQAYGRMTQLVPEARPPISLHALLSRLLMRHVPTTPEVRRRRYVYYIALGWAVFIGSIGFTMPGSWSTAYDVFITLWTCLLFGFLPAWLASRAVARAARTHHSGAST